MLFIQYLACSNCQKAKKWLDGHEISGLMYKSMNLKEKLPTMTEEEQLRLLATDGMLVKRPVVIMDDVVLTGFRAGEWEKVLL